MAYIPSSSSVVSFQGGAWSASMIGNVQVGSILTAVNVNPVSVSGSVGITGTPSISGTVNNFPQGTIITSLVSTIPSSVLVGASILGQLPAGTALIGSIATLQATTPWIISSVYGNISGSVVTFQGSGWSGSVAATVVGNPSISGTVVTTPPSNATTNVTQFGNSSIATGTGAGGGGVPRVTLSTDSTANPSLGQGKTLLFGTINQGAAGTTQLVAAQGAGLKIKVVSYIFTISLAGTAKFTGTADLTGAFNLLASEGIVAISQPSAHLFETSANVALSIVTTVGAAQGHFSYIVEA